MKNEKKTNRWEVVVEWDFLEFVDWNLVRVVYSPNQNFFAKWALLLVEGDEETVLVVSNHDRGKEILGMFIKFRKRTIEKISERIEKARNSESSKMMNDNLGLAKKLADSIHTDISFIVEEVREEHFGVSNLINEGLGINTSVVTQ